MKFNRLKSFYDKYKHSRLLSYRESRIEKAININHILEFELGKTIENFTILDYGCGCGQIAKFFSQKNKVFAVDYDPQIGKNNPNLTVINIKDDDKIPIKDHSIDIIISNHVIEHAINKDVYIRNLQRFLKRDGCVYLATPNFWYFREPHYNIFFLHWLPRAYFFRMLKIFGIFNDEIYFESPFSIFKKFHSSFVLKNFTIQMINLHTGIKIPTFFLFFGYFSPTIVYILKRK